MKQYLLLLFISAFVVSCIPTPGGGGGVVAPCVVQLTKPMPDPYSQPQAGFTNQASHQYVRFKIYSYKEYKNLQEQGIVLLDHSFDVLPGKDNNYQTENTPQYAVFYGVVPAGFNLTAYHAEKIRDLYMRSSAVARPENTTRTFTGKVTFFDPIDSAIVPLEGVEVQIKSGTKIISTHSGPGGSFSISSSEITRDTVEVLLRFDNDDFELHTLSLNDILGVRGINVYSLGFRQACSYDDMQLVVDKNVNSAALHHSCAMLLAINEYKQFAAHFGFTMPDKKFLIWLGRESPLSTSYATPMLQNMSQENIGNPVQLLVNLFGIPADQAAGLADKLKDELPDIYAPFYNRYNKYARASFIETMFHELSHSVHFAKVGPDFWLPYVEYIYGNGGYGYDSLPNSGIISMSESWAEDCSNIGLNYIYGKQSYITLNENQDVNWIPYGLYHDLYDSGTNEDFDHVSGITFPQIYALFTVNTKSPADLKEQLKLAYPVQSAAIDELFAHYGR